MSKRLFCVLENNIETIVLFRLNVDPLKFNNLKFIIYLELQCDLQFIFFQYCTPNWLYIMMVYSCLWNSDIFISSYFSFLLPCHVYFFHLVGYGSWLFSCELQPTPFWNSLAARLFLKRCLCNLSLSSFSKKPL